MDHSRFISEHFELTRRYFLRAGVMGMTASQLTVNAAALTAADELAQASPKAHTKPDKGGSGQIRISRQRKIFATYRVVSRFRTHYRMIRKPQWG